MIIMELENQTKHGVEVSSDLVIKNIFNSWNDFSSVIASHTGGIVIINMSAHGCDLLRCV